MTPLEYFLANVEHMKYTKCIDCQQPFSPLNTHTVDGWRETQISGMCEECFDKLFEGFEE